MIWLIAKLTMTNECTSVQPSLTATLVRWCDAAYIAWWRGSRASPEATGRHHWGTTHSVSASPQLPPGSHKKNDERRSTILAGHFDGQGSPPVWVPNALPNGGGGSRATPEATGCRHQVSIAADSINWSRKSQFFRFFSSSIRWKGGSPDAKAPNNNRGMTHQTDGKDISN